ncbi:hypothetical protein QJQ45_018754 [Haematococcus lacustris]|nr:hypothetical protein QJQ45_018754 [Haematococcus lacustris]
MVHAPVFHGSTQQALLSSFKGRAHRQPMRTIQDASAEFNDDGDKAGLFVPPRKVRLTKTKPIAASENSYSTQLKPKDVQTQASRIAQVVAGLADLSVDSQAPSRRPSRVQQTRTEELEELANIFDMDESFTLPVTSSKSEWTQSLRPPVQRVVLSHYQHEMINYQRMLLRKNIWYYRDRMNNARGPCPLHVLKEAWVQGVVDENTLMWGQGLADWLPAKNIKLLLPMIRTPEVRFGTWLKRTFALKPALNRIRENRKEQRPEAVNKQVERMR